MQKFWVALVFLPLTIWSSAQAMDGVFDREAEIQGYLPVIQSAGRADVMRVAKKIYMSGIADARIVAALDARLRRDLHTFTESRHWGNKTFDSIPNELAYQDTGDGEYGIWLVQALGSTGMNDASSILELVAHGSTTGRTTVPRIRGAAMEAQKRIEWHRGKNEIMASRANHRDGDDPQISRLINLLLSDENSYRQLVLRFIDVNNVRDARIHALLDKQVVAYIGDDAGHTPATERLIEASLRLLGESNDRQYAATMHKVLESNASLALKKRAQLGLNQLR